LVNSGLMSSKKIKETKRIIKAPKALAILSLPSLLPTKLSEVTYSTPPHTIKITLFWLSSANRGLKGQDKRKKKIEPLKKKKFLCELQHFIFIYFMDYKSFDKKLLSDAKMEL